MRYKTKDGNDYTLPGIGMTVDGTIETDKIIEHPLFELIQDEPAQLPVPPTTDVPVAAPIDVVQAPPTQQSVPPVDTPLAPVPPASQTNEQKEEN